MAKKTFNLILRVSGDWKSDLQKICKNKGRTMTGHIEHSLKLAKLMTDFCGGNDDLDYVERILGGLKHSPSRGSSEIKPAFLIAAEKKVSYKKGK